MKRFCKVCKKQLLSRQKNYCSNDCKFSDSVYNNRRSPKIKNDSNKVSICNFCKHKFKDYKNLSGVLTRHLKNHHDITYPSKSKLVLENFTTKKVEITEKYFQCPLCGWKTKDLNNKSGIFTVHLKKNHNLQIHEFTYRFPQFKHLWKMYFKRRERELSLKNEHNRVKCEICGEYFYKLSNTHLKKHNLALQEYKRKYNVCSVVSERTSKLQSEITTQFNLVSGSSFSIKESSDEVDFKKKLDRLNINYVSPFLYKGKKYDVFLPNHNLVVELDGDLYHTNDMSNLSFYTIQNSPNDYEKTKIMAESNYDFLRLRYSKDVYFTEQTLIQEIKRMEYIPDYSISYYQKIFTKESFEKFIETHGRTKLKKYVPIFLRFIRKMHPDFPTIPFKKSLGEIVKIIHDYDTSTVWEDQSDCIKNNIYSIGVNYLKSHFKYYWKCSFDGKMSPVGAWYDDDVMTKVIEYRIGVNRSGEIFDFSLHQLIRGLAARRYTISFFKPLLAAAIYKHFLGDNKNPVVIDPCSGFGGRLLGFKSKYPDGTYIGIEPNREIYSELRTLAENFSNVKLYNCKLEEYSGSKDCDLTFTSIPYFDRENYGNDYQTIWEWKKEFISSLLTYKNLTINISEMLEDLFQYKHKFYILNNPSHFSKTRKMKKELLLVI